MGHGNTWERAFRQGDSKGGGHDEKMSWCIWGAGRRPFVAVVGSSDSLVGHWETFGFHAE